MKKVLKKIGKIFAAIFLIGTVCIVTVGLIFGVKGYFMYREALDETPLSEKVEEIQQQEHFVSFEELPDIYVQAVIAVEDKRFYSHNGVDPLAIGRALWNDLTSFSLAEGGSTITQQLMKNQYFTGEKKLERKFAEVYAAWELESFCSKQEIFELYVNTIYFGSGYNGIYEAAMGYYGKEPSDLTEREAVMLAGLPNAPSVYALDTNPELARQRMNQVLDSMVECGVLSREEADRLATEA